MNVVKNNINKNESVETSTFPHLLNNTNLSRRPVCLEPILAIPLLKIYEHFLLLKKIKSHLFHQDSSLISVNKFFEFKNLKKIRKEESKSEKKAAAEFFRIGDEMKLYSIDGGLSDSNSAKIQHINKKIQQKPAQKYVKRGEFAKNLIKKNRLTIDNYSKHVAYKSLSKNERASIRYYLDKKTQVSKNRAIFEKEKVKSSNSILIAPILCIEIIVAIISARFYMELGLNQITAYAFAASVETFYMFSSSIRNFKTNILRYLILGYSIFTLGYSNIVNDSALNAEKSNIAQKINGTKLEVSLLEEQLKDVSKKKQSLINILNGYYEREMFTVALTKVTPKLEEAQMQSKELVKQIQIKQTELNNLKNNEGKTSYISLESLKKLQVSTLMILIGFILVQVCTSIFLPESLLAIKELKNKWGKPKKKRRAFAA